jgi:fibronectin type 3 domain-containing protein
MRNPLHSSPISPKVDLLLIGAALVLAACGRQQPQGIKKEAANPHSVTLSWKPGKSPVAGYNVYRVLPPGCPTKLSPSNVTDTQFTDHTVEAGNTYFYFITTVDSKGVESRPSEKLTVPVPTDPTPPAKQ